MKREPRKTKKKSKVARGAEVLTPALEHHTELATSEEELSEEQLEAVSGGLTVKMGRLEFKT